MDIETNNKFLNADSIFSFFVEDSDFYNTGVIPTSKARGRFMVEHNWSQV